MNVLIKKIIFGEIYSRVVKDSSYYISLCQKETISLSNRKWWLFKGYISFVPLRSTSGGDAAHHVRELVSPPLSPSHAYCFTVHHREVRETPCTEISCRGKGEGRRGEGGDGNGGTTADAARGGRISLARMRGAFRDLSGRRLLRLGSVVRDILSAIRFGVNVSCPPPAPTESPVPDLGDKPTPLEGIGGKRERSS